MGIGPGRQGPAATSREHPSSIHRAMHIERLPERLPARCLFLGSRHFLSPTAFPAYSPIGLSWRLMSEPLIAYLPMCDRLTRMTSADDKNADSSVACNVQKQGQIIAGWRALLHPRFERQTPLVDREQVPPA